MATPIATPSPHHAPLQEINQGYSEDGGMGGMGGSFGRGGFGGGGFGGGFGGFDEEDLFAHMFASQAGGSRRYSGARGGGFPGGYPGSAFGGFH